MAKRAHQLDRMHIASPCSLDWEQMTGDERVRFCGACNKNVYNISRMTRTEAEALIESAQGKLCAKFERRADGTILTADERTALAGFRWRLPRFAVAVVSTALSLSVSATAFPSRAGGPVSIFQKKDKKQNEPLPAQTAHDSLAGTVYDWQHAVIPKAEIRLINEATGQERRAFSSDEGAFRFTGLEPGSYTLIVTASGFRVYQKSKLIVNETSRLDVTMEVGRIVEMGVVVSHTDQKMELTPVPKALLTLLRKLANIFNR